MTNFQSEFRRSPIEIGEINGKIRQVPGAPIQNRSQTQIQDCDYTCWMIKFELEWDI